MTRVDLRIDELVLHGFGAADAARFRVAFEEELGTLLADPGAPRSAALDRLAVRAARPVTAGDPRAAGVEVARTIHREVTRC